MTGKKVLEDGVDLNGDKPGGELENSISPIDVLLNADEESLRIEDDIELPRLKSTWRFRSLTNEEFEDIIVRSTTRVKRDGMGFRSEIDANKNNLLSIYYACVTPDLHDSRLFDKFKVNKTHPEELIKKILSRPGEVIRVSSFVAKLSGFEDLFGQMVETSGNL